MPVAWQEVLNPEKTAVLCLEMQNGIVSKDGAILDLASAVEESGMVPKGRQLLEAARQSGVNVIQCTAAFRKDRRGTVVNTPLLAALLKNPLHLLEGTRAVDVISEWHDESDLECRRYHGISPFLGTDLDSTLRSLGIETVLVIGVSINLGVPATCIEAVNLGYRVVVVSDAVAGFPQDYCEAIMKNTISLLANSMAVEGVVQIWDRVS